MNLGIIEYWNEEGYKHAQSLGLNWVEFTFNHDHEPEELTALVPDIKRWNEQYGMNVGSIGRWGATHIDPDGSVNARELEASKKIIDVCEAVGCPVYVTGANAVEGRTFEQNCNSAVDYFSQVVEYASAKGVKVAVYNCDWANFVREDSTWSAVLTRVPGLGIKFDPSHCINVHNGDPYKEILKWADRIYHFHIKGLINIDRHEIDDPPAGLDMINWREIMGLLYAKGYEGMLSIEPHSHTWRGDLGEWGVRYTVNYIKPMIYPN